MSKMLSLKLKANAIEIIVARNQAASRGKSLNLRIEKSSFPKDFTSKKAIANPDRNKLSASNLGMRV